MLAFAQISQMTNDPCRHPRTAGQIAFSPARNHCGRVVAVTRAVRPASRGSNRFSGHYMRSSCHLGHAHLQEKMPGVKQHPKVCLLGECHSVDVEKLALSGWFRLAGLPADRREKTTRLKLSELSIQRSQVPPLSGEAALVFEQGVCQNKRWIGCPPPSTLEDTTSSPEKSQGPGTHGSRMVACPHASWQIGFAHSGKSEVLQETRGKDGSVVLVPFTFQPNNALTNSLKGFI